jgi:hypothetical protein
MKHVSEALTLDADVDGEKAGQSLATRQEELRPPLPAPSNPMDMLARAIERGVSPDTLDKLITLQERWEANQARKAFDEAMAATKAEMPVINKNRTVDFTSSKGRTHYRFEDLAEIVRVIAPILGRHGLSHRFRTQSPVGEPITVTCVISHRDGHFEENTLVGPRDDSGNKNPIQSIGSTITFLQRYTLKAALGLAASDDDDGMAAGGKTQEETGPISEEQVKKIRELIEETGAEIDKFCAWLKIQAIPDLPAASFQKAVNALEAKRRKAT